MSAVLVEIPYHNAVTRSVYSPRNAAILHEAAMLSGHECKAVAGFKQWLEVGRVVKKGEHGTKIYMVVDKKGEETQEQPQAGEEAGKFRVLKTRTVFFESQTVPLEGFPIEPDKEPTTSPTESPLAEVVQIVQAVRSPKPAPSIGPKLRALAEGLQAKIDHAFGNRLENTPKRRYEAARARNEGRRLDRTQKGLARLADMHDSGTVPAELASVTTKAKAYELAAAKMEDRHCGYYDAPSETGKPYHQTPEALAFWSLLDDNKAEREAEELRRKCAAVRQSGIPGFFPTPRAVVDLMIDKAEQEATFWENFADFSAGDGAIAERVRERYPDACLCLTEINPTLCTILQGKGFAATQADFLTVEPNPAFDVVLINPPFERLQDVEHVRHALEFLRPGGVLVAIMSAGTFFRTDSKSVDFRDWFEGMGGEVEDLPEGSFRESGTGVATKIVTIRRS